MSKTNLKWFVLSIGAFFLGWAMQLLAHPTIENLEIRATTAWNSGDVASAERLARRVLFLAPDSSRACDILQEVAKHNNRPELQVAATEAKLRGQGRHLEALVAAGDTAFQHNLNRLAEHYWKSALAEKPNDQRVFQRLTVLAGIRLDFAQMQNHLLAWCEVGTPDADLVLLYLGLPSLGIRDAAATEGQLRDCLEADINDHQTRIGLAKCLAAMNRHQECETVLSPLSESTQAQGVLVASLAASGQTDAAADMLSGIPPESDAAGEYFFSLGVIAEANNDWEEAERKLAEAVRQRPLSRVFRSRYCEVLRRLGNTESQRVQTGQLQKVIEITEISSDKESSLDAQTFIRLKELCAAVEADEAVAILTKLIVG